MICNVKIIGRVLPTVVFFFVLGKTSPPGGKLKKGGWVCFYWTATYSGRISPPGGRPTDWWSTIQPHTEKVRNPR